MNWKQYFPTQILERGYNYYKLDAVEIINSSKCHIDANVEGYNLYKLRITFENDNIMSMFCSCPYEGNCKHLAAALYYADNHPEIFNYEKDVENIINNVSNKDLKKFMIHEIVNDNDLLAKFKLFTNSKIDDVYYINKLKKSFSNSFNVVKFIDDDIYSLIKYEHYDLVYRLCNLIIDYLDMLDSNHEWYAFDNILDKLDTIMIRLLDLGQENCVSQFLAKVILTNDNLSISEKFSDTYSRIGDVEKLFYDKA